MSRTGIIGGSALYNMEEIEIVDQKKVVTPFGEPSDEFVIGRLSGKEVVFLPRHGRSHNLLPSEINYRANIYAFKVLEVDRIISVSAVGSLKENVHPLDMVLVDQFIDRTNQGRKMTFFGDGIAAHVSFSEPVCPELRQVICDSSKGLDVTIHNGGTYVNMEGPAFSTKAESFIYKSWGADVIGMTNLAEGRLAREAGICYTTIATVTDYDCWHDAPGVEEVSVEMIIQNLTRNTEVTKKMLKNTIAALPSSFSCKCGEALKNAIITPKDAIPKNVIEKLKPIIGKYI